MHNLKLVCMAFIILYTQLWNLCAQLWNYRGWAWESDFDVFHVWVELYGYTSFSDIKVEKDTCQMTFKNIEYKCGNNY